MFGLIKYMYYKFIIAFDQMITLYNYLNCKNNKICIKRIAYFAESVYLSFVKH